ncbi:hypothetical protein L209DRAFT_232029 [Thermothelomyces heterothallicus CBS 203.75]
MYVHTYMRHPYSVLRSGNEFLGSRHQGPPPVWRIPSRLPKKDSSPMPGRRNACDDNSPSSHPVRPRTPAHRHNDNVVVTMQLVDRSGEERKGGGRWSPQLPGESPSRDQRTMSLWGMSSPIFDTHAVLVPAIRNWQL